MTGLLFNLPIIFYLAVITIILLLSYSIYPSVGIKDIDENQGLTQRDILVAIFFTMAITPLNNNLGVLIFANLYNEKFAGLGVLAYTLGSLFASKVRKISNQLPRPIGSSVILSSLLFILSLTFHNQLLVLFTRFAIGSILFAAQGLLEERSKAEGKNGKGLDFLWKIFSFTAFLSVLILPYFAKLWGFTALGYLSIISGIIIMSLKFLIK